MESMGQTYKLSESIGLELVPKQDDSAQQSSNQPSLDFCAEGLSSVDVTNFTGRILIHRVASSGDDFRASFSTTTTYQSQRRPSPVDGDPYILGSIATSLETPAPAPNAEESISFQKTEAGNREPQDENVMKAISAFKDGTKPDDHKEDQGESTPQRKNLLTRQFGGVVNAVIGVSRGAKRTIPNEIRVQRREVHDYSKLSGSVSSNSPPTEMHRLCSQSFVTADELYECFKKDPAATKVKDANGRYPLHVLSDNESLILSSEGRHIATSFARHLVEEFPDAIVSPDTNGDLPFFTLIADWIQWASSEERLKEQSNFSARSDVGPDNSIFYDSSDSSRRFKFPRVELWEEVEWCFSMISMELDTLARHASLPTFHTRQRLKKDIDKRKQLIQKVLERLPKLYQTVLLLEDDGLDSRSRALETALFRRLLFCPEIVGGWLTDMIAHGGVPAKRAVDFFCMISQTTIEDYRGTYGTPHQKDWDEFYESQKGVFANVVELRGTMAALVTIREEEEVERAATTLVVWQSMAAKLRRPFILGIVLIDLVLQVILMFGFRNLSGISPQIPEPGRSDFLSSATIYTICLHYGVRIICECVAMSNVSAGALRGYVTNMWNVFDWTAIICTFIATLLNDLDNVTRNGFDAFVVGLLWFKVLAFLKVVNRDMAVFILSLGQILKDTRYFMFVLFVIVLMFGDMFHIAVVEKDDGAVCVDDLESGTIEDFCSSNWESYLRVYSMLLGDFNLDELTDTTGSTVLFVIFTIFGVIILLNILIAIISDSYEKATLRGRTLFARARLLFVAEKEALERFLKPRHRSPDRPFAKVKAAARWTTLFVILGTAAIALAYILLSIVELAHGRRGDAIPYLIIHIFCGAFLSAALWVVSTFLLDGLFRILLPERTEPIYDFIGTVNSGIVAAVAGFLFGDDSEKIRTVSEEETNEEEWTGRMAYTEKMLNRIVNDAKRELKADLYEMKEEVQMHYSSPEEQREQMENVTLKYFERVSRDGQSHI